MTKYVYRNGLPAISTFSIAAFNPVTKEVGVAVQSKFLAVGAAVPWVASDAGAIATQAFANTSYGPKGLLLLREGKSPQEVLDELLKDDDEREARQVGIIDTKGRTATFTGSECFDYAGGLMGENFTCQGNILAGRAVVEGIAEGFEANQDLPFAERLVQALQGGQKAGGDKRGMQSAALYIAKPDGGYGGFNDRYIDIRVDDHPSPIAELNRILSLHRLYFERSKEGDRVALTGETLTEVQNLLAKAGYNPGFGETYDKDTRNALYAYCMTENFDERWTEEAAIDLRVLDYLRRP
ncbi:DUF1028 domain-containing protein [Alicyclobacillus sp. SO9]|uniref:DUF1028 domain-containing protein n=1 Tax=Alicyclobacillus sp. SO9 TaxID=2665646 RepID=UPI0018E8B446|nr:DUF1028 domain-containing protein [Alicyclobacillus sp. SO9]QQE80363.1 DUF1028 domain-containing protein [Alicyclobacillus sp. SO9]